MDEVVPVLQHGGRPEGLGVEDGHDNNLYTFGELIESGCCL
jgi:hypothetical protein